MKYIQLLFVCTLFIGNAAYAQTPDNVMRAFENVSPDELDQDNNTRPAVDANIHEDKSSSVFSIYPNPTKGGASKVSIRDTGAPGSIVQLSIIDGTGFEFNVRQIKSSGGSYEYDLNEFNVVKPGMYTVKVVIGQQAYTEQWIVQ
ncbi:MAG: hypothetical protein ACI9AT_001124 [Ulvibacter sp.]|jgi:hypothetical protein